MLTESIGDLTLSVFLSLLCPDLRVLVWLVDLYVKIPEYCPVYDFTYRTRKLHRREETKNSHCQLNVIMEMINFGISLKVISGIL